MTEHVVQMSSGVASAYCAHLVADRYGRDHVHLLFADVARTEPDAEWWEGEDPDNYRFLRDIVDVLDLPLTTVCDGRGVWGLARDMRMIPNNRAPFCSRVLKHQPALEWLETHRDPADTILHVGIDVTEAHRCDPIAARWDPWPVEYPMMWGPQRLKTDALEWVRSVGVDPPRMYAEGYPHANCAGACVRMGNGAAERLYRTRPDVYAGLERREAEIQQLVGSPVSILVDRRDLAPGEGRRPYPLATLRSEIERRDYTTPTLFDDHGCGRCWGE